MKAADHFSDNNRFVTPHFKLTESEFLSFLFYVRARLEKEDRFTVFPEELAEHAGLRMPFWEDLEESWREQGDSRPKDFDFSQVHSVIEVWKII